MTVKIITCAALLLAACGGAQPAKEETKAFSNPIPRRA